MISTLIIIIKLKLILKAFNDSDVIKSNIGFNNKTNRIIFPILFFKNVLMQLNIFILSSFFLYINYIKKITKLLVILGIIIL